MCVDFASCDRRASEHLHLGKFMSCLVSVHKITACNVGRTSREDSVLVAVHRFHLRNAATIYAKLFENSRAGFHGRVIYESLCDNRWIRSE